ncbi:hypothetical protein Cgig2_015304 [Carnegiea gigantea]|uniref:CCHC-type domain-containing protein n=1 Tax=Carnegiea gigantea TaxID=171969 RepID=A0A9Q1JRA6_9CARY|nr:hypothetical protein Cgig2_015304 [Carnegiea gigantea]
MVGNMLWITIKYVKLPDICYACGVLGHVYRRCCLFDPTIQESDLQYSPWIRASPIKKKAKAIGREIIQERQRLLELREGPSGSRIQAELHLDGEKFKLMRVDSCKILVSEGEVSKRKKGSKEVDGAGEWKLRVIEGDGSVNENQWAEVASNESAMRKRLSKYEMDAKIGGWRVYYGVAVDAIGRSGGIAMLWLKEVDVMLVSYSAHHINVHIKWATEGPVWRFTDIYGWSRWRPRSVSFPLVYPINSGWENAVVANFIDFELGTWCDQLVRESHVKRDGNRVAHSLAHRQPLEVGEQLWIEDGSSYVLDLVAEDWCNFLILRND